jgi:dTMP kinase
MKSPRFIVFEGGDACGKTTQSKALFDYLASQNYDVMHTREPGGTEFGEKLREIILNKKITLDIFSEVLLHSASRNEHVRSVIKPALEQGKIVICDRFIDSTLVYQGLMGGVGFERIISIHETSMGKFYPDVVFVMEAETAEIKARISQRSAGVADRYESVEIDAMVKRSKSFRLLPNFGYERIFLNSSLNSVNEINKQILELISLS